MQETDLGPVTRRRYTCHSFQERKRVVELHEGGLGSKRISQIMGIDDSLIRFWIRKYRALGEPALQPYWRGPGGKSSCPRCWRKENEPLFNKACEVYAQTLDSMATITRRYGLDYHSFRYHITRYHPELVARRKLLKTVNN